MEITVVTACWLANELIALSVSAYLCARMRVCTHTCISPSIGRRKSAETLYNNMTTLTREAGLDGAA